MKVGLKGLITILGKRYGAKLVARELAAWDGREVKDFKLYFSEVCRRAHNLEKEKKIEYDAMILKTENRQISVEGKKILDQIQIKDIFKATKLSTEKERLDKKNRFLIFSSNDKEKLRI